MELWKLPAATLEKMCESQAEKIRTQEKLIKTSEQYIQKIEGTNTSLLEKLEEQQKLFEERDDKMKQLIQNQERMIEILMAENRELGGEISKDLD